jgi:hypothetical protein
LPKERESPLKRAEGPGAGGSAEAAQGQGQGPGVGERKTARMGDIRKRAVMRRSSIAHFMGSKIFFELVQGFPLGAPGFMLLPPSGG